MNFYTSRFGYLTSEDLLVAFQNEIAFLLATSYSNVSLKNTMIAEGPLCCHCLESILLDALHGKAEALFLHFLILQEFECLRLGFPCCRLQLLSTAMSISASLQDKDGNISALQLRSAVKVAVVVGLLASGALYLDHSFSHNRFIICQVSMCPYTGSTNAIIGYSTR